MEDDIQACGIIPNLENFNYDDNDNDDEQVSDCESSVTCDDDCYDEGLFFGEDLVQLDKDDPIHNVIHNKFLSCLGDFGHQKASIVAIHKKIWSNYREGDSKLRCFEIYRQGLKNQYGNDIKMKYAWYGTSKKAITRIMSSGFDLEDVPIYNGLFGGGVYLYPINFLTQSVNSCVIDDDGLMHVMLCRVLTERDHIVANRDSSKSHQLDSDNSNSGVDDDEDIVSSTMYLVKGNEMGTHILPEYVVSFRTPCLKGVSSSKTKILSKKPNSPWLAFSTLISVLNKFLPPKKVDLINNQYRHFKERKISRLELIQNLKRLVGVDLLVEIVKSMGNKGSVVNKRTSGLHLINKRGIKKVWMSIEKEAKSM